MFSWVLHIATKQLRFHWKQTIVSVLGITLSVIILLVILSFSQGIDSFFGERILRLSPHLTLEAGINDFVSEDLMDTIEAVDGILGVAPYLSFPGLIQKGQDSETVMFRGVDWEREDNLYGLRSMLDAGDWNSIITEPGILLGGELARLIRAQVGDVVHIISPELSSYFVVEGIFFTGYYANDAQLVLMPLGIAQNLLNQTGLTGYGVSVAEKDEVDQYILPLQEGTDLWVRPWYQREQGLFISMAMQRAVMLWVTAFSLLIATLGIMNVFLLRAWSQQRNAGILRTLGATPRQIGLIYGAQGAICGLVGGFSGLVLARIIVHLLSNYPIYLPQVFYVETLPIQWAAGDVFWVLLVSVSSGLLAAVYPAWRLSRIPPVEVMANE